MNCEICRADIYEDQGHSCSPTDLMERIVKLNKLTCQLIEHMNSQFAWTFTLADNVAVKVEFYGSRITARHVRAFLSIFAAVVDNYGEAEDTVSSE